jgi:hypothetical protein
MSEQKRTGRPPYHPRCGSGRCGRSSTTSTRGHGRCLAGSPEQAHFDGTEPPVTLAVGRAGIPDQAGLIQPIELMPHSNKLVGVGLHHSQTLPAQASSPQGQMSHARRAFVPGSFRASLSIRRVAPGPNRTNTAAISTGQRNTSASAFGGDFQPSVCRGRSVELTSHGVEVGLGVHREVGVAGEVLTQKAAGVLVRDPLPAGRRRRPGHRCRR